MEKEGRVRNWVIQIQLRMASGLVDVQDTCMCQNSSSCRLK